MVTLTSTSRINATSCSAPARLSLVQMLRRAVMLHRSRRALTQLSAAQLEDIGVSPQQAAQEAERALWDAPVHWYQ